MKKESWFIKTFMNPWFFAFVVFGIGSFLSFAQINTVWADKNHFNGLFGWLGIGIVTLIIAIACLIISAKTSTGKGG